MNDKLGTCYLYTWFSSARGDHFTTSDPAWIGQVGELRGIPGEEYELMRMEGRVFSPEFPQPPGTLALVNYWNPERGDNFLTSQPPSVWDAETQGYIPGRLEGYVYDSPGEDRLPLSSYWNPELADNLTTSATTEELFSFNVGWAQFGIQGYLLPPVERVVPLNTWYSAGRQDHFTTTDPNWAGVVGDWIERDDGYQLVRVEGRVFSPDAPQPKGTVPLWNFWNPERGDNFLTTQAHWVRSLEREGYVRFRLEGFLYAKPGPGRAELNSYWNAAAGDNAATSADSGEMESLTAQWGKYRSEGYLFPQGEFVHPEDISEALVPSALLRGDREFDGHGPDITVRLKLAVDPSGRHVIAKIYFLAFETVSNWSTTEANWEKIVYTAPAGKTVLALASPATSEVRFISPAAGFQFLFPGEDFAEAAELIEKVAQVVVGVLQFVPKAGEIAKVASDVLSGFLQGVKIVGYSGNAVSTVVATDGPVMFFAVVGDTGGNDISDDGNPKDDTRIVGIRMLDFEVVLA